MSQIRESPSGPEVNVSGGIVPPAGQIGGTQSDPLVVGITTSDGDELPIGSIADGQFLKRSGLSVVSAAISGAVSSVFGRVGAIVATLGDYTTSLITNASTVTGATATAALDTLKSSIAALVTGVSSVFSRAGAVVATLGDYTTSLITNASSVTGSTTTAALNNLLSPPVVTYVASQVAQLSDAGSHVLMNVAGGNTYTIPLNATVAFPVGTLILLEQYGAGVTQLVFAGGVTSRVPASYDPALNFSERYQQVSLKKIGTDEWSVIGGLVLL